MESGRNQNIETTGENPNTLPLRRGRPLHTDGRPLIMGIVNATPDSFHPQSRNQNSDDAVRTALAHLDAGADILDIGGESTRPGAEPVSETEELARVVPVIRRLRRETDAPISVDTTKTAVAAACLDAGADIVNDVTALRRAGQEGVAIPPDRDNDDMARLVAETGAVVILMYMRGCPRTMRDLPPMADAVGEVRDFLKTRVDYALAASIRPDRIWLDPGFGFGKNHDDNARLLWRLDETARLGYPVCVGISRKRFAGETVPPEERLAAGLGLTALAWLRGARIFRTHDPRETKTMLDALHQVKETTNRRPPTNLTPG